MKIKPLTHFTKDGKEIIIRQAEEGDAAKLIALKKGYLKNSTSIPMLVSEYKNDQQMEKDLIHRFITERNSLLLVAEHNDTIIGNIDIIGSQRKKMFHTGVVGMGIANGWRNMSIGSYLMETALNWTLNSSHLSVIWLEVYSDNKGGIKLYEKFGFEPCGLIKNFFMEENPVDKITMVKYL